MSAKAAPEASQALPKAAVGLLVTAAIHFSHIQAQPTDDVTLSFALKVVSKPLPVLALALFLLGKPKTGIAWRERLPVIVGLLISGFADVVMAWSDHAKIAFLGGLGSFLAAHVAYIIGFAGPPGHRVPLAKLAAVPVLAFLVFILRLLLPNVDDTFMLVAVSVYGCVICSMLWQAVSRVGKRPGAWWAVVGAILFAMSDSVIALGKFNEPALAQTGIHSLGVSVKSFIMITYWLGQVGIAAGVAYTDDGERAAAPKAKKLN